MTGCQLNLQRGIRYPIACEELSNSETAELLGLHKSAASKRYRRALERLTSILSNIPGFFP